MQALKWYGVPIPGILAFYWLLANAAMSVVLGITAGLIYRKPDVVSRRGLASCLVACSVVA